MKRILATLCLLFLLETFARSAAAQSWNASGPRLRGNHSAVLDTSTNRMIVFGGFPFDTNSTQNLNDVWRLNGAGGLGLSWVQVKPKGTQPAPRWGHSAAYDPGSNRMIVFGGAEGRSSPCANDVWILTNANGSGGAPAWSQLSPAGGPPAARTTQGGVYDPTTNTLIIYGGQDCGSTVFGDVWILSNANGIGGTPTWTQLSPSGGGPGPREAVGQSVIYDSTTNELILFAGQPPNGGNPFNDVWVLSNANGSGGTPSWTQLSPTGTPPAARAGTSATYDPTTNRMIIFGGASSSFLGDAWILFHANGLGGTPVWASIVSSSVNFPGPREGHTAVYNPSTNKMTIFGGQIASAPNLGTNDVFVLRHANGI